MVLGSRSFMLDLMSRGALTTAATRLSDHGICSCTSYNLISHTPPTRDLAAVLYQSTASHSAQEIHTHI